MTGSMLLAALLWLTAFPAAAHTPTEVSQDPLVRQIFSRQLQANGGVTAAVRVRGTDKGIPLELAEPGAEARALAPLLPAAGLARKAAKAERRRPLRRADEQLGGLERQGPRASWERAPK